jgi:hypothetical protein
MNASAGPSTTAFLHKVEYLEELVRSGNPDKAWVPRTLEEAVSWQDAELGLRSWKSYTVAALNGPNAALRRRYDAAIAALRRPIRPPKPTNNVRPTDARLAAEHRALAGQNSALITENGDLRKKIVRMATSIQALQEREQELVVMLNKILPPDRRMRVIGPE